MTGVLRHMAEHCLNVREGCPLVRQKKRGQAPKRNKAIQEEVEKLVDAGIMKEVHYHSWLSNPDGYPLPEIDWKVESLYGYPFKCFLDAYKGYHQIKMAEEDEEKTAFITSQGIFCYTKMPFGLKNAGATYQRLVDKAFQKQIGRSRTSLQTDEETHSGTPNADCTKGKGGVNHVPSCGQGSYQRSFNDRKRRQAIAIVLCEPCPTRAGDQLHPHGKIGISLAQRKQTAEKAKDIDQRINIGRFYHGSSCIDGFGTGLILTNPEGVEFTYTMRFRFEATNNEAEYEALIAGLRIAEQMGIKNLQANVDSRLVANQVNGSYVAKESGMVQYLEKVKMLASNFKEFSIKQVPRSENKKADALSKIASTSFTHLSKQVLVDELKETSIHEKEVLDIVEDEGKTWMTPICEYITKEILPEDKKKSRVVRRKASRYTMMNGTLYK
ncbi:reverse transcriptase domain-containing protein [Tanacetum coccineum]